MPRLKSYLDTTLRIIHINRSSGLPAEVVESIQNQLKEWETSSAIRREMIMWHLDIEHQNNDKLISVLAHEYHHYLQGLFYPFLYYLSWLELDNLIYLGNEFKNSSTNTFDIREMHMNEGFFRNFNFLYQQIEFYWENHALNIKVPEGSQSKSNIFTLNDLLEDATTIFEYRTNVDEPSADGFNKWIADPSNNCYKKTYRFLQAKWGTEEAFHLLPLIVQIAFSCTDPATGFCHAVSYINFYSVDYRKKSQHEIFVEITSILERSLNTVVLDPELHHLITEIPVAMVRYEDMGKVIARSSGIDGSLCFPPSLQFTRIAKRIQIDPTYQTQILGINKKTYNDILKDIFPYAIHYHYMDFDGRSGTIVMAKEYINAKTPQELPYPFYIKELIKIKETHLAVFTRIHNDVGHNCHHKQCKYYSLGLCKLWNSIPKRHEDCGFPFRFEHLFNRKIDLERNVFLKISSEEAEESYAEFTRRSFKRRTFEYLKINGRYVLTIDANDIKESSANTMFPDFIEFLKEEFKETSRSLFSSITLDFYGYNHDTRELFDIPELVDFMKATKQLVPELLFYIDFNAQPDHRLILLPMFLDHQSVKIDGKIQVYFDPQSYQNFCLKESNIWINFMKQNAINPTGSIIANILKILS